MNAVPFVTDVKIFKFLNYLYIILKFLIYLYLFIYLFILSIDYFLHFIDLFSSEILAILLSTINSKLNKVFD